MVSEWSEMIAWLAKYMYAPFGDTGPPGKKAVRLRWRCWGSDHEAHEGHEELHFLGNYSRGYALESRGEFNLKEKRDIWS